MSRHSVVTARTAISAIAAVLLFVLGGPPPAAAEPATPVSYPGVATATRLTGYAFDTCDAPSLSTMAAWVGSRYRGVGVYVGGVNRTCAQANLTAGWVRTVAVDWRIIPIYMGHQPPCGDFRPPPRDQRFTTSNASAVGTADAADAVIRARALGLLPGSAIYGDVENYDATSASCRDAVLRYLSAWTKELHRVGYLAGVYANLASGARHLADAFTSTGYARPDALWIARYDHVPSLTGWTGVPDARWSNHQRAKQYWGNRTETYGGVAQTIDSNRWDAPVATVKYSYRVTSTTPLAARSGPGTAYAAVASYPTGATIDLVCQTPGSTVGGTAVWNKLTSGAYVTDRYLSTPSETSYSAPVPRCKYPFQVTRSTLSERLGPAGSQPVKGTLVGGALAWVFCQAPGTTVGATRVWDRLDDGYYVPDHYVASPSRTGYSRPVPRC